MRPCLFVAAALTAVASLVAAQTTPPAGALAIDHLKAPGTKALVVSSPTIRQAGRIPLLHSDYGEQVSPSLRWSAVPPGTRSIAVLMEDPDAQQPTPFVHWLLYDLPATIESLPEALPAAPRLQQLGGAHQGRTSRGNIGYFGPRPPKTDPPHHYHFQVFALDTLLNLDPGAGRDTLLAAMRGHVLAAGNLTGSFKAPSNDK